MIRLISDMKASCFFLIAGLGLRVDQVEEYRREYYRQSYNVHSWYEALKPHTFRTISLNITPADGRAVADKQEPERAATLAALEQRIDGAIRQHFGDTGCFVKLGTRSPKDVPLLDFDNAALQALLHAEMRSQPQLVHDLNHRIWAFIRAGSKALRVTSGAQALHLLTRSERVREDLNRQLAFPDPLFQGEIVLREWLPELAERPEYEFRGFVNEGRLNALTMYFCRSYSAELHARKTEFVLASSSSLPLGSPSYSWNFGRRSKAALRSLAVSLTST